MENIAERALHTRIARSVDAIGGGPLSTTCFMLQVGLSSTQRPLTITQLWPIPFATVCWRVTSPPANILEKYVPKL